MEYMLKRCLLKGMERLGQEDATLPFFIFLFSISSSPFLNEYLSVYPLPDKCLLLNI